MNKTRNVFRLILITRCRRSDDDGGDVEKESGKRIPSTTKKRERRNASVTFRFVGETCTRSDVLGDVGVEDLPDDRAYRIITILSLSLSLPY